MKTRTVWGWLSIAVFCAASARAAAVIDQGAELLDGKDWQALALITGFHSVQNKKAGFHARLLEADGSATTAFGVSPLSDRRRRSRRQRLPADGSIPFSSTKLLDFFFWKVRLKRFAVQSFQTQEAIRPPSSTVNTRRCCAPATASGFT
jgi:hypothetical protein